MPLWGAAMLDVNTVPMAVDLAVEIAGIRAPNPFWLASAPPTNSEAQVRRAFEAGWGGAVWKTINREPIVNVSARYGGIDVGGRKLVGMNNIELISDRPLADNLAEIARTKRAHPGHALLVSLMEESRRDSWHDLVRRTQDAGADGVELNFGCPHGMSERGMGSAVGQVPEYAARITGWVKEVARVPVVVKLTPNVASVVPVGRAVVEAGADALSLINTINSIMGVDLDTLAPRPSVAGAGSHGGYSGPAVKPIALQMVSSLAGDPAITVPIIGMGGIVAWQDAAEFLLLGASAVQVCTAVMHHGFRVVDHLVDGLTGYLQSKGVARVADLVGRSVPRVRTWGELDLNYKVVAQIDQAKCIGCGLCYAACEDGCHQAIRRERAPIAVGLAPARAATTTPHRYEVMVDACVGCNMCHLICPVAGCITMDEVDTGRPPMTWAQRQARLAGGAETPASA